MAIYRTRGLYALNQPSRYVGQSEDFRDWLHTAPEEDVALCERASEFEEHFADMLFDSSVIDNADECTEDGESFDFQPEELHDFTLSWVRFSVAPLDNGAHGAFIDGYNTPIQIWPTAETGYPDGLREYIGNPESYQCAYVIISPEYANDDSVLLHEMIHVYETVLDDFPTFYRDILLWQLYKRTNFVIYESLIGEENVLHKISITFVFDCEDTCWDWNHLLSPVLLYVSIICRTSMSEMIRLSAN